MSLQQYLPSAQFATIAASLAFAASLVVAADYIASPKSLPGELSVGDSAPLSAEDWQKLLEDVQGNAAFAALPEPLSPNELDELRKSAESDNVTSTVARSLLISLTDAKSRGQGGDIPTQEHIVGDAIARLAERPVAPYAQADLLEVGDSAGALREYGNAVIEAFSRHGGANSERAFRAFALAVDNQNAAELESLRSIGAEYRALADELAEAAVPRTLAPLHLRAVNNLLRIAQTFDDMRSVLEDPLRGLAGYQRYLALMGEEARLFASVAEALRAGGASFTSGEPGAAWSAFLQT